MAYRKMTMNKTREILRLKEESGLSLRKIARVMKLSRPVITDHLERCRQNGITYETAQNMSDDKLESILSSKAKTLHNDDRYLTLADRFKNLPFEIKRVGVTRQILWEEYRRDIPDGYSYSQYCAHFQAWTDSQKISMHIEHKAGDKMFVDYAGKKLSIVDRITGEIIPVEVFVAIMGASQLIYVEATLSQMKRDFINANVNALHYMGGVPAAIVPDNLKSGVTEVHRYEPDINPDYIDFARHYGTTILPARPYKPKDKALAEVTVNIVYQRIYAPLRDRVFYSLDELNAAILEELDHLNNRTMKSYGKSRRELFEEIEKSYIRMLPIERYCHREFARVKAQFNYHVYLTADKHYYSVPFRYRGHKVDVFYSAHAVEIYHRNERIAVHLRDHRHYKYTTVAEHMPPEHRFCNDWSAEKFISMADAIGNDVKTVVEAILSLCQHPEQGYRTCMGIMKLARQYGNERICRACRKAVYYSEYSCRAIGNILKNNMDAEDIEQGLFDSTLPVHENIRGSNYYTTEEL
jgi:transposase